MNTYTKLTLDVFKKKLKDGGYNSIAGARRAIGKAQEWSEADREKAGKIAEAHFGSSAAPAPKKAKKEKKAPVKAAPKKAKVEKKAKGKPGRKKASATVAPAALLKEEPKAHEADVFKGEASSTSEYKSNSSEAQVALVTSIVGTMSEAISAIKLSRDIHSNPKSFDREVEASVKILGKAVRSLESALPSPAVEETVVVAEAEPAKVRRRRTPKVEAEGTQDASAPTNGASDSIDLSILSQAGDEEVQVTAAS